MSAKPKFDYNGQDFYDELFALSYQGLTDAEIADSLSDKFGQTLTPEVFCKMKNGNYEGWNDRQNETRSQRISQALARGRRKINAVIRGMYLKVALGGKKVKSTSKVSRRIKLDNGELTNSEEIQTTENEQELAPNVQALSTWLYNHDEEWKKATNLKDTDSDDEGSIEIDDWIKSNSK